MMLCSYDLIYVEAFGRKTRGVCEEMLPGAKAVSCRPSNEEPEADREEGLNSGRRHPLVLVTFLSSFFFMAMKHMCYMFGYSSFTEKDCRPPPRAVINSMPKAKGVTIKSCCRGLPGLGM